MYQIESARTVLRDRAEIRRRLSTGVSRNVVLLGLVSMFTDVSSEMVATILPLYLVFTLGVSPLQFGVVDGLYQGAAALMRVASGFVADRWRRYKDVAFVGYALSALSRVGFLVTSSWSALSGIVVADRVGKGIRTAPRDALISLSTAPAMLATAFGVHRALDTAGAMVGPLIAFAILALVPGSFDSVFVVSFCFALIGLALLALFVENRTGRVEEIEQASDVSVRAGFALARRPGFSPLVLVAAALALTTMSDGFVYLGLQRQIDFEPRYFPLLYVGTAFVYMALAVPLGRLADRVGRGRVFLAGYAVLLIVYASLLLPSIGAPGLVIYLVLLGTYYAATEGVLMALASAVLPAELRATGLAFLVTATSIGRLFASIVFGALWTAFGIDTAVIAFGAGLALAIVVAGVTLARSGVVRNA